MKIMNGMLIVHVNWNYFSSFLSIKLLLYLVRILCVYHELSHVTRCFKCLST